MATELGTVTGKSYNEQLLDLALQAMDKSDLHSACALIRQVLMKDIYSDGAWRMLYEISGEEQDFNQFKFDYAK